MSGIQVHADIRVTRGMKGIPPMAQAAWGVLKGALFAAALVAGLATILGTLDPTYQLRMALTALCAWAVWDRVIARTRLGEFHVLVTDKGVLSTMDNAYVRWEHVESWREDGILFRVRPKTGHGPRGLFAATSVDIPVNDDVRDTVREVLLERVGPARP